MREDLRDAVRALRGAPAYTAVALAVFTAASWPLLRVGGRGDQVL